MLSRLDEIGGDVVRLALAPHKVDIVDFVDVVDFVAKVFDPLGHELGEDGELGFEEARDPGRGD